MAKFILSVITAFGLLMFAANLTQAAATSHVLITELQTNGVGSGTTEQEFIELNNPTPQTVDLTGWYLRYVSSTGSLLSAKKIISFGAGTKLYSGGSLVVAPNGFMVSDPLVLHYVTGSSFGGISYDGATVDVVDADGNLVDRVGWGTKPAILTETAPATAPKYGLSIERKTDDGQYVDSNNNSQDFETHASTSPNTLNPEPPTPPVVAVEDTASPSDEPTSQVEPTEPAVPEPTEPTPEPTVPALPAEPAEPAPLADAITTNAITQQPAVALPAEPAPTSTTTVTLPAAELLPPKINELMVDPALPLSDSTDEWVELYNPNQTELSLLGYQLLAGDNLTYKYTFSTETIPPNGYLLVTSGETPITLSNSGGRVVLKDLAGQVAEEVTYQKAETGSSYAKDTNGEWKWTTTPTASAPNTINYSVAAVATAASAAATSKTTTTVKKTTAATKVAKTPSLATKVTSTQKAVNAKLAAAVAPAKKKVAATKGAAVTGNSSQQLLTTPHSVPAPILAAIAGLVVLYLGYEYRFEINNKLYQFREYRSSRPKARP